MYGEEKAKEIMLKRKKSMTKWTKNKIVKAYLEVPPIKKSEFHGRLARDGILPYEGTVRKFWNSLDELAEETGKEFLHRRENCLSPKGKNEKQLLDKHQKLFGIKIDRDISIKGTNGKLYFPDGYDRMNNIIYEVDEIYHKYRKVEDFIREKAIKDKLKCEFVRIKDGW